MSEHLQKALLGPSTSLTLTLAATLDQLLKWFLPPLLRRLRRLAGA
jgi:hypothetical protein